ncbi:hypothetical protein [Paenibacillus harenae]|uniref:hypothetical protein n=1 Tax=Paenibacillus harenae TaxID=306543 RepID=UPI00278D7039|nr:hypothetical protein [Paenibacillus harenae]MDQ0063410.1 hypothetical protein [Paenibacillus harenae]
MNLALILFIACFWFSQLFFNDGSNKWYTYKWVQRAILYAVSSFVVAYVADAGNLWLLLVAAPLTAMIHYPLHIKLLHKYKDTLLYYSVYQIIQIAIIYVILFLLGQADTFRQLVEQLKTMLFANELYLNHAMVIPIVLLILAFLTVITPEIVSKILRSHTHPIKRPQAEVAASIESLMDISLFTDQSLKGPAKEDMTIERQIEMSIKDVNDENNSKKESIKLQYMWYNTADDSAKGKYIGILERLLICLFVIYEVYPGLALVGAMKTLARFKMFDNRAFAEYYLIGTLFSLLIAAACGFLLKRLLVDATIV